MKSDYLEPEFAQAFGAWQADPSPTTTGSLLRQMQPAIDRGISAHVGTGDVSPLLRSRAKRLAIGALKTYNPQKSRLTTHIVNHMKGLQRVNRQQQQILHIPERQSLDQAYLSRSEAELEEKLGRPPSIYELSDHSKLSPSRIKKIRDIRRPMQEGSLLAMADQEEGGGFMPAVEYSNTNITMQAVYDDLDPVSQNIMDWTLGLHGRRPLSNQQIAAKLKLTPGAISQRKAMIQQKLDEMEQYGIF